MTASARLSVDSRDRPEVEAARATAGPARPRPVVASKTLRILLISKTFKLPYRVLRCAKAAGCDVFVLSAPQGASLRTSRLCDGYNASTRDILGHFDPGLALEINLYVQRLEIDMVLPGDGPSTRSLIAIRHLIEARCFPMPELEEYDLLNDKWQFAALCRRLKVRCPDTFLFANTDQLSSAIDGKEVAFPVMVKPLNLDGSAGCVVLEHKGDTDRLKTIDYSPILLQNYIDGEDISASVFCLGGQIKAFVTFRYQRDSCKTFFRQSIYDDIAKICAHAKLDGVYNFDMRRDENGEVYFLECNPRFFFRIAMSMLAGVNFVAPGLPGQELIDAQQVCAPTVVQFPKAMLAALPTPWRLRAKSWDALKYVASDPVPYFREELGLEPSGLTGGDRLRQRRRRRSHARDR